MGLPYLENGQSKDELHIKVKKKEDKSDCPWRSSFSQKSKQSENTFLNVLKCILYFKKKSRQKREISAQGRGKDRYDNTKNKQHETVEDYVNIIPWSHFPSIRFAFQEGKCRNWKEEGRVTVTH